MYIQRVAIKFDNGQCFNSLWYTRLFDVSYDMIT